MAGKHDDLQQAAIKNEHMFAVLMEATKYCSLGQSTAAMFEMGAVQEEHVRSLVMIRAMAFVGLLFSLCSAHGQGWDSMRYEFVKENGKPKLLKSGRSIELHLKDSLPPIAGVNRTHQVDGNLLRTTKDSIVIGFQEEHWTERVWDPRMDWSPRGEEHRLFVFDTLDIPRSYALTRIDHITYDSNIKGAGTFITVVSALGLLVYAPLKAMKFKDGSFDGEKYIQVATPCLIGVGIGLVVMPFTESKRNVNVKLGM